MPQRKAKPTIIAKYSLEEIYIKKRIPKGGICVLGVPAAFGSTMQNQYSCRL